MPAMAAPLAADKLDAWEAWAAELSGPRKAEFDDMNARHGLTEHRAYLQPTPDGNFLVLVIHEGPGGDGFVANVASSDNPFDQWFAGSIVELHEMDMQRLPPPMAARKDQRRPDAASTAKEAASRCIPSADADRRPPAGRIAERPWIEPVGERELVDEEARRRRLGRGPARAPYALRGAGEAPGEAEREIPPGRRHAGRRADPLEQRPHRQRLAVRDHEGTAGERSVGRELLGGGHESVRGVVDVGCVDQGPAARDDEQPPRAGPLDDPPDQLGVAGTPDHVRANGRDRERGIVRGQSEKLGLGLRLRVPRAVAPDDDRLPRSRSGRRHRLVAHGRRGDDDEPRHSGRHGTRRRPPRCRRHCPGGTPRGCR